MMTAFVSYDVSKAEQTCAGTTENCRTAFHLSTDTQVQVACQVDNVSLSRAQSGLPFSDDVPTHL